MAARQMQRALMNRRATSSLDAQRIEFEKSQMAHFAKATSVQELPVKTKHVRGLIIGTHQERGAGTFWALAERVPLQEHPITCWKFCHVLHKVLREGYRTTVKETLPRRPMLRELATFWGHLPDPYGKLIDCYMAVVVAKLRFHAKYHAFPGTLTMPDDALERLGENDPNEYFEMAVEILDYLEAIVNMQVAVFGSLDVSRATSMTKEGQCRLAPLIPCIQDSLALYNHVIKIMFRLHAILPPDLLSGHRTRFNKLFPSLKQFYHRSANLQYFKTLIQVPQLPESPPNFFRACQQSDHVEAAVILPEEEEDADLLVDMSETSERSMVDSLDMLGEPGPPPPPPRPDVEEQLRQQLLARQQELAAGRQRVEQLEMQLAERESLLQSERETSGDLAGRLSSSDAAAAAAAAQAARTADDKFQKMKSVYQQLREEHIRLIRAKAEADQQLLAQQRARETAEAAHADLQRQLSSVTEQQSAAQEQLQRSEARSVEMQSLRSEVQESRSRCAALQGELQLQTTAAAAAQLERDELQNSCRQLQEQADAQSSRHSRELHDRQTRALADCVSTAEQMVQRALDEFENPMYSAVTCTPEYLLGAIPVVRQCLDPVSTRTAAGAPPAGDLASRLLLFGHVTAQFVLHGKATSNTSPDIQLGEEMSAVSASIGSSSLQLLASHRSASGDPSAPAAAIRADITRLTEMTSRMTESLQAVTGEQIAGLVDQEMAAMDRAIEAAAARIQEILLESRTADSGVKLEVNEKILDSCTGLMRAIKVLVQRSRHLQAEIIAQGKGTASPTEFYKRNHRWTEGLISAAKAVGISAQSLLSAADRLVSGTGKFEELIVVTHEIAASSAQLVIASKVKAARDSQNLANLGQASRGVSEATGSVVATAKSCMQLVEDKAVLDFGNLSLHQTKRQEMESQVRVLELEVQLQRERTQLSTLRRQHYQLAGDLEGWEEVDHPL